MTERGYWSDAARRRFGRLTTRLSRRRLIAGAAGAAALLAACGGKKAQTGGSTSGGVAPSGTSASAGTPKRGGTLTIVNPSSSNNMNPVTNFQEGYVLAGVNIYDRLVSARPNYHFSNQYKLEAAGSVEQPDPLTVIFKLKPGMKYQDLPPVNGRAVVAGDIVKLQNFVRDNPGAENNSFLRSSMDNVSAPDDQTVTFKLKQPNAYLFSGTQLCNSGAQCMIPPELLDNLDKNSPVGSGPYQMDSYQLNVRYRYKRFDGYRDASKGLPYIDAREYVILQDPAAQEASFRSAQTQLWNPPLPSLVDTVSRDLGNKVTVESWLPLTMQTLNFNITRPPWNDQRAREAMYRVVNRQQWLDLIWQGKGKVPPGPLSAGLTAYQLDPKQTDKYFKQDAKAAKQLLDAAGFPYGKTFDMPMFNRPQDLQGAGIFKQQVAPLGMKVNVRALPAADWLASVAGQANYDIWFAAHPSYDSPQVPLRLQATDTQNLHKIAGLRDPQVDQMIYKSETIVDPEEQIKAVKEIEIALLDKYAPMVFIDTYNAYALHYAYLKGYEINAGSTPEPMYRVEMWLDK